VSWANALFRPDRVAVVGSPSRGKIGRVLIDQLLDGGFTRVGAVNPKGKTVRGVAAATSVVDLASSIGPIDLVIVASPAVTVPCVLEDAGKAGTKVAVIITAGFSEANNTAGEFEILEVARQWGLRVVGPNCAGIVNTRHHLFPTLETRPPAGDVALVSQSGALGGVVLSWAEEQGIGISTFVSYGNGADLTESDFLDALREDEETRVVALYVETVSDGRRFMESTRCLSAVKPLIVIKSGRSESGSRATRFHTGSMAGADAVFDAALKQCGAIRIEGIEEMFDVCRGFASLPPVRGRRLAVVTNSGGPGVLAADAAETLDLSVRPPSDELRRRLSERLTSFCGLDNPFDLTVGGTEADYRETLIEVLDEYDAALAININTPYLDSAPLARGVVAAAQATDKPIVASFMAGSPAQAALPVLRAGGVPNFATGERGVGVLARMARYSEHRCTPSRTITDIPSASEDLPWEQDPLEPEAMDWLEDLGFPVLPRVFARTPAEAVSALAVLGGPVAMKVVSPGILHKSDQGGVLLNVGSEEDAKRAFYSLQDVARDYGFRGVLVSPMVPDPVELLVGTSRDPQFGPVIACGLGGIYTEMLRDVAFRVAPIPLQEARDMLSELRGRSILHGARGRAPRDLVALEDLLVRISRLPFRCPRIAEIDLNPVFSLEQGFRIGDVRVAVKTGT